MKSHAATVVSATHNKTATLSADRALERLAPFFLYACTTQSCASPEARQPCRLGISAAARFAANSRSTDGDAEGIDRCGRTWNARKIRFHINALHVTVVTYAYVRREQRAGNVNPDFSLSLKPPSASDEE